MEMPRPARQRATGVPVCIPNAERRRYGPSDISGVVTARHRQRGPLSAFAAPDYQSAPPQLPERLDAIAAGPACDEQLAPPVSQCETAPGMHRADAAPVAALAARMAERPRDLGRDHAASAWLVLRFAGLSRASAQARQSAERYKTRVPNR
jgi:hypothetical protein